MASSDSKDTEKAAEGEEVRVSNSLDPDETPRYAASHLDPNCLQRYSLWQIYPPLACLLHESEKSKDSEATASTGCCTCTKKKMMVLAIVLIMILLYALGIGIGLAIGLSRSDDSDGHTGEHRIPMGAVISDHEACSEIGRVRVSNSLDPDETPRYAVFHLDPKCFQRDMLRRHGTMLDAALATLICIGVRVPHSAGIGGGCSMVIYDKGSNKITVIDGMTVAPSSMTLHKYTDMTNNNITARKIGVPGELEAYKMAHDMYGFLPWSELFQPTIKMLKEGFPMSESTAKAIPILTSLGRNLNKFPTLCSVFCANTTTGEGKKAGEMIYWPKMATTLEGIARDGPEYIDDSDLSQTLVNEIQADGGIMKYKDLKDYYVNTDPAYSVDIGDYNLYTMPGATGGPVVAMITNIIQGFNLTKSSMLSRASKAEIYHKIAEAMKFSYADRAKLADPAFENVSQVLDRMQSEEYASLVQSKITPMTHEESYYTDTPTSYEDAMGTSQVSVISPYGDAVSITSTVNHYFGSMIMSNSTGIIWNNEMDDFATKETDTVNIIEPRKRPRSSMAPVIVVDKRGRVKLVIGGAGGAKIANAVAQVLIKLLWLEQPLDEAIEEKRFHHMLAGNTLIVEQGFPEDLRKELENKGHKVKTDRWPYMAVVGAILVDENGTMKGYADSRKKPGKTSYMYEYEAR